MTQNIATWFHVDDEGKGEYAQVRGDTRSESFRDTYRRCIAVFFLSARRANPEAVLWLFLNEEWKLSTSTSREVYSILQALQVRIRVVKYTTVVPKTFTRKWRNQFYVLDVLEHFGGFCNESDSVVLLDSDVVWTTHDRASALWRQLEAEELLMMPIGYDSSEAVNGLSGKELAERTSRPVPIEYAGGEFIAVTGTILPLLVSQTRDIVQLLLAQHRESTWLAFEEAHVLSVAYQKIGAVVVEEAIVKRLWTQPLKFQNVTKADLRLALWHVPAEKKYGLRRLYKRLVAEGAGSGVPIDEDRWMRLISRLLGVPRNTPEKWFRDVSGAALSRLVKAK
jgi:hypothetical protein